MELIFKCKSGLCMNLTMRALQIKRNRLRRVAVWRAGWGEGGHIFFIAENKRSQGTVLDGGVFSKIV